jgi:hypothetical protein
MKYSIVALLVLLIVYYDSPNYREKVKSYLRNRITCLESELEQVVRYLLVIDRSRLIPLYSATAVVEIYIIKFLIYIA